MAAILPLDSSLIGYLGGVGRAFGAIGKSMNEMGQAKLDLEQQDKENASKAAYLKLQENYYNDAQKAKEEAKQERFDSNLATNRYLLGDKAPQEMSNEYARLGQIDPAVVAKSIPEAPKIIGEFKGSDGNMWNRLSDGSAKPVNAPVGFYDSSMFDKNIQYVTSADGKSKVPTLVLTNMFSGENKLSQLPGETQAEYNARLSSGLSLNNTLITQKNTKELGLKYDPEIQDAKDAKEANNTLSTLSSGGFTKQIDPGMIQFYQEKAPDGYKLNVRGAKVNGVDVYVINPNKMWIKPASR